MNESLDRFLTHNKELLSMAITAAVLVALGLISEGIRQIQKQLMRPKLPEKVQHVKTRWHELPWGIKNNKYANESTDAIGSKLNKFETRLQSLESTLDSIKQIIKGKKR